MITMARIELEPYVLDVLLPDLAGHDRSPAAFLVYLYLLGTAARQRRDTVGASLQTIATRTGLSKSTVQVALRHLARRGLVDSSGASTREPQRRVLRPWVR